MELIVQAFLFFITFTMLFKRDRFCALFYLILYIYMLPDEVCCGYFPFLLKQGNLERIYEPFVLYSSLSLFLFWTVLYYRSHRGRIIYCIDNNNTKIITGKYKNRENFVYILIIVVLLLQMFYIYASFEDISYKHLASVEYKAKHPMLRMSATLYKISSPLIFLLLFKVKSINYKHGKGCVVLLLWAVIQNFYFGVLAGSRSGILAIIVGVLFIFYGSKRVSPWFVGKVLIIIAIVAISFSKIRFVRSEGRENDSMKEYVLLQQDYIGPEINTIVAFKYNVVNPSELICSNFMKIFPFNDYPYLYLTMAEIFAPGSSDASAGYGFYIFTEGYLFAGQLGIFYNGIYIALLLLLWRRLGRTNDPNFNTFMMAVMMSFFFAMVRSQSSSFFRNIWSQLLPMAFLYTWFMGIKLNYKKLFLNLK